MPAARVHLVLPELIADFARTGPLCQGLHESARLVGAELTIEEAHPGHAVCLSPPPDAQELPVRYRGQPLGRVAYCAGDNGAPVARIATAMALLLEHALEREMAVGDLANAMTTSYEELHMLHSLLSEIAIRTEAVEIAQLIVDETARTLNCRRVSLLVLDEARENLRMLASRGLPPETREIIVPTGESVAGRVLFEGGLLVVDDVTARPDLAALSRGRYETDSFAVIRVPLSARGEPVGVLAATERTGGAEFTTRDCKLFEGLSSIGASALLNCRLHAAVSHQMMSTIQALASAVDAKDHYIHDHSAKWNWPDSCTISGKSGFPTASCPRPKGLRRQNTP
jgi:putative methionine-R-sulfoxide reductase with GAF domain